MKLKGLSRFVLTCGFLAVSQIANAGMIIYTDRLAWESNLSSLIVEEDFNDVGTYDFSFGANNAGLIDINISGDSTGSNRIEDISNNLLDIDGTNYYLGNVRNGSPSTVSELLFEDNISAFGADWVGTIGWGDLVATFGGEAIKFSDYFSGSGVAAGTGFLGFISSNSFDRISLSVESASINEAFGMDNVAFSVVKVSEPNILILMLISLCFIIYKRRV